MEINKVKNDFGIFQRKPNGKPIVYLDSAATSLKPKSVVEAMRKYDEEYTANINRGVYLLSEEATVAYEEARRKVADFIGSQKQEIVFVRNATEAINLVMYSWGRKNIDMGDEIIVTGMEHHANLVPWQILCRKKGAVLKIAELNVDGTLNVDHLIGLVSDNTKLLAMTQVSNVLGTINDVRNIVKEIRNVKNDLRVLVDGAQAVPHMKVDVSDLGCDWYVFSGHKMLAPSGIGVLWGKQDLLEEMDPFLYGGDMIRSVGWQECSYNEIPHKFEAGTPYIAGAIGLGAAVDYLDSLDMGWVREHERDLVAYAIGELGKISGIRVIGLLESEIRAGVISFVVEGVHPHDVAQVLDEDNVYIRAGHHCAMPLHTEILKVPATCRASFYVYNDMSDVDKLVEGLNKVISRFKS